MPQNKDTQQTDIKRLWKLVQGIQFAMMTTIDAEDQSLRSRPMTLQKTEFDGSFWFFTGKNGGPAADIEVNPRVNLAFSEPKDSFYVSVTGVAAIVTDRQKERELWSPMLSAFFPLGLADPTLALMHVQVESADYWESPSSKVVQLVGFAKAVLRGKKIGNELGLHRHLDLQ